MTSSCIHEPRLARLLLIGPMLCLGVVVTRAPSAIEVARGAGTAPVSSTSRPSPTTNAMATVTGTETPTGSATAIVTGTETTTFGVATGTDTPTSSLTATATMAQANRQIAQQAAAAVMHRVGPSILTIAVRQKIGGRIGTGFVCREDATGTYVVTSASLLLGAKARSVRLVSPGSGKIFRAQVIVLDAAKPGSSTNLGVIRMQPTTMRALSYGNEARLHPGDPVVSVGSVPAHNGKAASDLSTIFALHHDLKDGSGPIWIWHSTALDATAIGGPLLGLDGNVEGINLVLTVIKGRTAMPGMAGSQFFALPSASLKPVCAPHELNSQHAAGWPDARGDPAADSIPIPRSTSR